MQYHSTSDLITNSSTEIFTVETKDAEKKLQALFATILAAVGYTGDMSSIVTIERRLTEDTKSDYYEYDREYHVEDCVKEIGHIPTDEEYAAWALHDALRHDRCGEYAPMTELVVTVPQTGTMLRLSDLITTEERSC